ncbi:hypothetical protein VFPFJ_09323 [Purpureocillium lilacinum]|uniref:Uncharacterized protein n=1 Tax=Purpureocillium lilacinum TaxID=33203 RepID=A0A179GCG2_PURLI|nr:hypothetical protein VFPFJ_09323 [Purpureocillium lilacinum]OAQ75238.1 hypothetical protein VFPBJ_09213 [Purpureocillium lilacinum]OAQ80870.1 hypothetical protein VFPFJ_09323 [Purpureocillium lilacinum]
MLATAQTRAACRGILGGCTDREEVGSTGCSRLRTSFGPSGLAWKSGSSGCKSWIFSLHRERSQGFHRATRQRHGGPKPHRGGGGSRRRHRDE